MASIIVDIAAWQRRNGTIPPKKGAVKAAFMINDVIYRVSGSSFNAAIYEAKRVAREQEVYKIILEEVELTK